MMLSANKNVAGFPGGSSRLPWPGPGHFFNVEVDGEPVEAYQTDLVAVVGNLGGPFRYGVSPQGCPVTILSDASCHDVNFHGQLVHNIVTAILELRPTVNGTELTAETLEYAREDETFVPVVEVEYGDRVTGELSATTDGVGVARYRGRNVSSAQEPRIVIRNDRSADVYLKQTDRHHWFETATVAGVSHQCRVDVYAHDSWRENRAIVLVKHDRDDGQDVLFCFTALEDARAAAVRMTGKLEHLDNEIAHAKRHYAGIMRRKSIDVLGSSIRHLEFLVDTVGTIPQRTRIDGKPASTWGEQIDQLAIPVSALREVGEGIARPTPAPVPQKYERLYRVNELVVLMHFLLAQGSFTASLPFDAVPIRARLVDPDIEYTASAGYGGMEWPGRDGAHLAADLARDGWHIVGSEQQLYTSAWSLVSKLLRILEDKSRGGAEVPWSFGPWEHFKGRLAYVGVQVSQAFRNAAYIADKLGYSERARHLRAMAFRLKREVVRCFWNDAGGYFIRGDDDRHFDTSPNLNAIITGFLDLSDAGERSRAGRILDATVELAFVRTPHSGRGEGGILRMEDEYFIGPNPWFVCTGQYVQALELLARAEERHGDAGAARAHRAKADRFLGWIVLNANPVGGYPEQKIFSQPPRTNPGFPVPPLADWTLLPWSSAEVRKAIVARCR